MNWLEDIINYRPSDKLLRHVQGKQEAFDKREAKLVQDVVASAIVIPACSAEEYFNARKYKALSRANQAANSNFKEYVESFHDEEVFSAAARLLLAATKQYHETAYRWNNSENPARISGYSRNDLTFLSVNPQANFHMAEMLQDRMRKSIGAAFQHRPDKTREALTSLAVSSPQHASRMFAASLLFQLTEKTTLADWALEKYVLPTLKSLACAGTWVEQSQRPRHDACVEQGIAAATTLIAKCQPLDAIPHCLALNKMFPKVFESSKALFAILDQTGAALKEVAARPVRGQGVSAAEIIGAPA